MLVSVTSCNNGVKCVKQKQKVVYLSKYWFDFDDVDIKLYVFWNAKAMLNQIACFLYCMIVLSRYPGYSVI